MNEEIFDQYFTAFLNKNYDYVSNSEMGSSRFKLNEDFQSFSVINGSSLSEYQISYQNDGYENECWVIFMEDWVVQYVPYDYPDVAKAILRRLITAELSWDDLLTRNHYRVFKDLYSNGYNYLKANNPYWRKPAGVSKYIELEDIYLDNDLGSLSRFKNKRQLKKILKSKGLI